MAQIEPLVAEKATTEPSTPGAETTLALNEEASSSGSSTVRWLAYIARVKASVFASKALVNLSLKAGPARYFAFTSDLGEAFRPRLPLALVNASYGISVAYIFGAIGEAGVVAQREGKSSREIKETVAAEATFQFLASLLLPFLVIHTTVHKSAHFLKARSVHLTHPAVARWAPTGLGLCIIPALPPCIDVPCEHAVEAFFNRFVKHEETVNSGDFRRMRQESQKLPYAMTKAAELYKAKDLWSQE